MRLIRSLGEWLDARLQVAASIREIAEHPVPRETASWFYVFGSAAFVVFMLQIVTGILLALSISVGETAPLIYTAGYSSYMWDGKLTNSPVGYLTGSIWTLYNDTTTPGAIQLAYAAAFLVTALVLAINIIARVILRGAQASRV